MDDYMGMTPEQLQQLISLGVIDDKQGDLQQQWKQAQLMRNQNPHGNSGMVGKTYVADPLGSIVAGVGGYKGGRDMRRIEGEQDKLRQTQTDARMAYLNAMIQQRQQAGGATPGQPPPPMQGGAPMGGAPPQGGPGSAPVQGGAPPGGMLPPTAMQPGLWDRLRKKFSPMGF